MDAKANAIKPSDKTNGERRAKYDRPAMVVYGDIRAITQNVGPKGAMDSGGGAAAGPKTG
jgi:hypothetical protein